MKKVFVTVLLIGFVSLFAAQVQAANPPSDGIGWFSRSYMAIEQMTGLTVGEKYYTGYKESEKPYIKGGKSIVETEGYFEFARDGQKRRFWCHFDYFSGNILRLAIDGSIIYSDVNW